MYFLYILLMFLSLLGLVTLVKELFSWFLHIKNGCSKTVLFLPFYETKKGDFSLEAGIALSRAKWYNMNHIDNVFAVNCSLSKENADVLKELSRAYDICYIDESEIGRIIGHKASLLNS